MTKKRLLILLNQKPLKTSVIHPCRPLSFKSTVFSRETLHIFFNHGKTMNKYGYAWYEYLWSNRLLGLFSEVEDLLTDLKISRLFLRGFTAHFQICCTPLKPQNTSRTSFHENVYRRHVATSTENYKIQFKKLGEHHDFHHSISQ